MPRAGLYCGANRCKELLWPFGCQVLARPLSLSFLFLFTLTKVESSAAGKVSAERPGGKRRGSRSQQAAAGASASLRWWRR